MSGTVTGDAEKSATQPDGYQIVQQCISAPPSLVDLACRLVPGAFVVARERIGVKCNDQCGTRYAEDSVELFLWALGLICQEWILENLRRKSQDGHCWNHDKPCSSGSRFHRDLYDECKRSFRSALEGNDNAA